MTYLNFNEWNGTGIPKAKKKLAKKKLKPKFKYAWISYTDPLRPRGKIHRYRDNRRYMCGHYADERHDKNLNTLKEDMITPENMCKRCFSDWIIYPDESLPEELFTI